MEAGTQKTRFFGIPELIPFLAKYKKRITWMIICGLFGSAADIIFPVYRRYALDRFIVGNTLEGIGGFIALYLGTVLFAALVNYIAMSFAFRTEVNINRDLRNTLFTHIQTRGFSYFNRNSVGYIHSRLMSDTSRIGSLVSWSMMDGVWHMSYLIGAVIVMFAVNARLALYVVSVLPVIAILFSIFQTKLIKVNREVRELNSVITSGFNEGITGVKTIKALGIEEKMEKAFYGDTSAIKKKSIKAARLRGAFQSTMTLASSVVLAIVLWKGGHIEASEVGTFSMFIAYAQEMMEPLRWLIEAVSDLIVTQVNIERISAILAEKPDVADTPEVIEKYGDCFNPKTENFEPMKGDIEFRNISFRYPDGDEEVLENFNLKIPSGSNIAIVGETGAGKSTLVNLLCRFYEPTGGTVFIDGKDVRERSQNWLHSNTGYVLQTPHLFTGTIRENLLYGNPDATEEQIWESLKIVSADEIVNRLEKGLDSDVGEGGDLLSAGEKQLISFARAIICDPRILVLDEATASVDTLTEARIHEALDAVIEGRTTIVIAHRLSTVKNADRILVVRDGKIIEQGTHPELMQSKGYYHALYTRQYEDEATKEILG